MSLNSSSPSAFLPPAPSQQGHALELCPCPVHRLGSMDGKRNAKRGNITETVTRPDDMDSQTIRDVVPPLECRFLSNRSDLSDVINKSTVDKTD